MREPGGTGSTGLLETQPPTLEEVMDFVSEFSTPWSRSSSFLSTVTVSTWPSPVEPTIVNRLQYQNGPSAKLMITEQPKQRGMRFRYQCEGRSAGSILGENSTDSSKTLPAIALLHCGGIHDVKVSVCLVWKDPPHRIHPHGLVGKDCHDGICEITLHPDEGQTQHSFSNLGIQCVRKKEIESSVKSRLNLGIDPYNAGMWRHHEEVDLNVVRLCFQAWYTTPSGQRISLKPVLSEPVYDKKSTNTSELKIYRMNKDRGRCDGGEELYILCDKVQKEDIQVIFVKDDWEARADFSQADVHRQIAIVVKTPPYRCMELLDPAPVQVCLQRITDGIRSEGVSFTYMPYKYGLSLPLDSYGLHLKRPRLISPLDGLIDLDPHGIDVKRIHTRPDYRDHCSSIDIYSMPDHLSSIDQTMNLMDLPEPRCHKIPRIEDSTTKSSYLDVLFDDLDKLENFGLFGPDLESEATTSLVDLGLALTGHHEQHLPDFDYQ